jgi:hypothetical protein
VADTLISEDLQTAEPSEGAATPVEESREPGHHRGKFRAVYLLLGVVLGVAIAGFVALLVRGGPDPGPPWSAWQPQGTTAEKAQQIADYVGSSYRLESGGQLVSVQAAPLRVEDVPIGAVAIRRPPGLEESEAIDVFPPDKTSVYILCGLGEACSIEEGQPSPERLRLLKREALELALYTFRYLDRNAVVVFLPPAPGEEAAFALYFRRGAFEPELNRPLRLTLPAELPPLPHAIAPAEVLTIDRLTDPSFFRFSFQRLQDGTAVLVLDDPTLPPPEEQPAEEGTTTQ